MRSGCSPPAARTSRRNAATGERITKIVLFVPRLSAGGRVIGYEEPLRSRKPMTIVVLPREERAVAAPSIAELIRIARLEN